MYDAIVVGSGAAGGWAAKELTRRGLRTLLLEAGRTLDTQKDFPQPGGGASKLQILDRVRGALGGQEVQARCMSFSEQTRRLFVNDRENPYTTDGGRFNWYRGRQVGGRLHLWGRNAVRISDEDLHAASRDGYGPMWPIDYSDLAPWYEQVERFLGVWGSPAGIANLPDGEYAGPLPITQAERRVLDTLAHVWPELPATTARIVRHHAGPLPLTLEAALQTGLLELRSDAVVSRIETDPQTGLATGLTYLDRRTKEKHTARGRCVVVCASTIESLRILLHSKSARHPAGIGNSTGLLGHGLTDHVFVFRAGPHAPIEASLKEDPFDFGAQTGIYIPSFRNTGAARERGFLRGYSLLGSVGRIAPGWFFMAVGEMLPRHENCVVLDKRRRDAWGIPLARIRCEHSDNERAMVRDMIGTLEELAGKCGLELGQLQGERLIAKAIHRVAAPLVYTPDGAMVPGSAIHESGGAPMGDDPKSSVLNRHNQCWDAPNVYVTDSAAFPTSPFQNPGLTIMALSARAGNHIADHL
ncbi:MAG: GMC family oxidoreductase [Acidobacteriota bacterium]